MNYQYIPTQVALDRVVKHLLKHLKPGGLEGDADLAVEKI